MYSRDKEIFDVFVALVLYLITFLCISTGGNNVCQGEPAVRPVISIKEGSEILKPIAVISLNGNDNNVQVSTLENFATASNSQLVYACNEFGERIAVGLYVTESFTDNSADFDKNSKMKPIQANAENEKWIGAVEECVTQETKDIKTGMSVNNDAKNSIKLYKVNKGKRKQSTAKSGCGKKHLTLKEIKKKRSLSQKGSRTSSSKCTSVIIVQKSVKKRKRKKKKDDKTFPVPKSIRDLKFERKRKLKLC